MSAAVSPVTGRFYGLAAVCRAWRVCRATVYRRRKPPSLEPPRRPGPVGPMPDTRLLDAIRAVLADSTFHGEGHRKVSVAALEKVWLRYAGEPVPAQDRTFIADTQS